MSRELDQSYLHCQRMAQQAASNFYYTFALLPREKRRAMYALYAFSRHSDDLSDAEDPDPVRAERLGRWRESLAEALRGEFGEPLLPAVVDTTHRFAIPPEYLFDIIDGVSMDLTPPRFETFEELAGYCYRVASVVGLACVRIWGGDLPLAEPLAVRCGYAFQLTNILRDVREDARWGRIYLPRQELARFDVTPEMLAGTEPTGADTELRLRALLRFQIQRAHGLFDESAGLDGLLHRDGRRMFRLMFATYRQLLTNIESADVAALQRRVSLSRGQKLRLLAQVFCGSRPGVQIS